MTPFDSLFFFCILALFLVPAVIIGLCGKPLKYYSAAVSLVFLLIFFKTPLKLLFVCTFSLWQFLIVKLFMKIYQKNRKRYLLWIELFLMLVPMFLNKFRIEIAGNVFGILGLSYISFRCIQIAIDGFDNLIKEIKAFDFFYFILFFPTISSGPIDRSRRFCKELACGYSKEEYRDLLSKGVMKIACGVFYNFVLSNLIYSYWLCKAPDTALGNISYAYGYTLFLFFNFAGYSQMAIGTSYLLGVKLNDNFNMPFGALDLKDFWARWHISLSTWLRDYVYSRFVMSALKKKWFKDPLYASYIGYIITMMTMGLWHGLELHFIVYGAYHGILLCINDLLDNKVKWFKKAKRDAKWQPIYWFVTMQLVVFGMLIFSGRIF